MMIRSMLIVAATAAAVGISLFAEAQTPAASAPANPPARGRGRGPVAPDQAAPQNTPAFPLAHQMLLEKAKKGGIDVYFLGDSITRRWQGTDYLHKANWDQNFFGWNAANFGWGGDTTQNVLWRLESGELDGVNPKVIVLLIGTNNVGNTVRANDDAFTDDVAKGVKAILDLCRKKAPDAKIILMGILPRNDTPGRDARLMPTISKINDKIEKFADGKIIRYLNINNRLTDKNGIFLEGMAEDRLHLTDWGYQEWADALKPIFTELLGPPAKTDHAPAATGAPAGAPPSANSIFSDSPAPPAPPRPASRPAAQ
jgi:lysophospholipase L1-like esterase